MLDRFPSLLAMATFFVLSLAVTHEWAYYSIIGSHFQSLMSPTDYLSSALLWLPYIAVTWAIMGILTALQWRIEGFTFPIRNRIDSISLHILGITVVVSAVVTFLLVPPDITSQFAYGLAFCYVWTVLLGYFVSHEAIRSRLTFGAAMILNLTPILFVLSYTEGLYTAKRDLMKTEPTYQFQSTKDAPLRSVVLLRNLDKGVLVQGTDREVQFYKWSDITEISHTAPIAEPKSHACQLFGWFCNWRRPAEPPSDPSTPS